MLSDLQSYWIKIAVNDRLEIDPVIANPDEPSSTILLPFEIVGEERVSVFGDVNDNVIFTFSLSKGHHLLT